MAIAKPHVFGLSFPGLLTRVTFTSMARPRIVPERPSRVAEKIHERHLIDQLVVRGLRAAHHTRQSLW